QVPKGLEDFTLINALQKMIDTRLDEQVQYNRESNALIINARATKHKEIADLLKLIDVEPQQVFIDVKFITTTNKNFWRAGLKFGDPTGSPGESGVGASLNMKENQASPFPDARGLLIPPQL